ncbi:DUF1631 family protein [Rudaea sp.]|uniref:DUF1631 family protein n=1 Tax=Rudaea sp. TaxID=2136325 RepID=UPI002ED07C14
MFDDDSKRNGDSVPRQDWWGRLSNAQVELLRPLSAQLFEKLDDTLFDRSESSSQQFFEGMRILRRNRDVLTQTWFDHLAEGWNALRPQAPGAFRPRLVAAGGMTVGGGFAGLSLVDEVTLERNLAVESAVARGSSLCRMELPPLLHRLSILRSGADVQADEVPAAPAVLVRTFAKSLDESPDLPVEVALVVLKLFDRIVVSMTGVTCQELNRMLVQGGVAPHWNWSSPVQRRSAAMHPTPPPGANARQHVTAEERSWLETVPGLDAGAHATAAQLAGLSRDGMHAGSMYTSLQDLPPETVEQARLTASVRALLEHRRLARYAASRAYAGGHHGVAGDGALDGAAWGGDAAQSATQALGLETLMEVLASLPPPTLPTSWVGDAEEDLWDPERLKLELRRNLGSRLHQGRPSAQAGQADERNVALGEHEDVIDMVAMMFGFIQKDDALPAAVQALLSRLQLPYLRLALIDAEMFSDADHPARALMDRLAEVGKGCTPDSPMLAEKMLRMHSLVGRIVKNHDVTRAFFERERAQFRAWSDMLEARAAERERDQVAPLASAEPPAPAELPEEAAQDEPASASDSAEQPAHQHQIRLAATARMRERLEGKSVPEGLRHALSIFWVNHQVRICEARGKRSYEALWLDRQLDAVVGLLSPMPDPQARASLEQDWADIERAWAGVLGEGSAPAEARARWINTFRHWAEVRIGRIKVDPTFRWNWLEGLVAPRLQPRSDEATARADDRAAVTDAESVSASSAGETGVDARVSTFKLKPIPNKSTPPRWKVGDWIGFKDDADVAGAEDSTDPKPSRAGRGKVSWIGAFTGRTILVKTDGTLWREEGRAELDDLLDRGLAVIVPRESLFDRSLQSMFQKLRSSVASALS